MSKNIQKVSYGEFLDNSKIFSSQLKQKQKKNLEISQLDYMK